MIHPDTELKFINDTIGYGVVATRFIPKGTITWIMDKLDRVFHPSEIPKFEPAYQEILNKYCFRDNSGNHVLCWDISRFVNHSFKPNCISTAYDFELAVRDIYPGEELTDDYGFLNVVEPFECLPEDGVSRKKVMPDDLLHFHKEWDAQLLESFENFNEVSQPLKQFLSAKHLAKVEAIAAGQGQMDSILLNYYDENKNGNGHKK
jgi:uncharacterized protein